MDLDKLASSINAVARLRGSFTLRSGVTATEYFDKYRFESDPVLLAAIADHMRGLVPTGIDALAGLELGGVPVVTALSLRSGLPAIFVRKTAKDYGTCQLVEGLDVAGRLLCIVEDVVTSGGQIIESCIALRALGASVEHALCVIDRETGGTEALAAIGLELRPLFRRSQIDRA
ncbi:MAG: phosphoribosyltransferase family protein [Actinomycetota bacterium]